MIHDNIHVSLYCDAEKRMYPFCPPSIINYLVKKIGALCKLRPQGMLGPVYPEISSEGLGTDAEGHKGSAHHSSVVINTERRSSNATVSHKMQAYSF